MGFLSNLAGCGDALHHRVLAVFLRSCFCIQPLRDTSTACQTLAPVSRNPTDDFRSHGPDSLSDSSGLLTNRLMPLAPQVKGQTPCSGIRPRPRPPDPGRSSFRPHRQSCTKFCAIPAPHALRGLPAWRALLFSFSGRKFLPIFQTQPKGNSHPRKDAPNPPTFPLSGKKL